MTSYDSVDAAYIQRRGEIPDLFRPDRSRGLEAFRQRSAALGRIRATVREGRSRMRLEMLSRLPRDLAGWRILDAGCGTGAMSVELARRGADVLGIDLAPEIIRFAQGTMPTDIGLGRITFASGDMLAAGHGEFDAVVAMDSLIHYQMQDGIAALEAPGAAHQPHIIFTFACKSRLPF